MPHAIARLIDHALLHPTLTDEEIRLGCLTARDLGVASVCVKPYAVQLAVEVLRGSSTRVGTVIGFPHGSNVSALKAQEADLACGDGACELDMVVNIGKVLSHDWDYVRADIRSVREVAERHGAILKVIFETDLITADDDKRRLCEICTELGCDFVKTSTGFGFVKMPEGGYGYRGATEHDVQWMRACCGPNVQVKASGGIRDYEDAQRMQAVGATRLGTSASETIVKGAPSRQEGY
jgi:deoxyribose-phosphate aldolase